MVAPVAPAQHPALTAAERLVVTCSAYDRCAESLLRDRLAAVPSSDWPHVLRLMERHQLSSALWYQLEPVAGMVPPEIVRRCRQLSATALATDIQQGVWLEQIAAAFEARGLRFAVVKGILWHRWWYGSRPLPRGAADLDLLVFGGEPGLAAAVDAAAAIGFRPPDASERRPPPPAVMSHDLTLQQTFPNGAIIKLDLHRAPSAFHLGGAESRRLMAWFERQRAPAPWRADWPAGPTTLPSLTPSGCVVYAVINLLKEGTPTLRAINDLAILLTTCRGQMVWKEVEAIVRRTGLETATGLALAVVRTWAPAEFPARRRASWLLRRVFDPYLTVPAVVRWPLAEVPGHGSAIPVGGIQVNWWVLAFGWRAAVRGWLRHERRRWACAPPGLPGRALYLVRRPPQLAGRGMLWAIRLLGDLRGRPVLTRRLT